MKFATADYEQSLWNQGYQLVVGIDEVGRGCFAGPVVVGAVIFSPNTSLPHGLADSKLLTPKIREKLEQEIKETALGWAIEEVSVEIINNVGIGKATQIAFHNVIQKLKNQPDFILIDAFYIQSIDKNKQKPIVGGDRLSVSIAAASIIAKVYRDKKMLELDKDYPHYGFAQHKGYGTKQHQQAIKEHGLCALHRSSFDLNKFLN